MSFWNEALHAKWELAIEVQQLRELNSELLDVAKRLAALRRRNGDMTLPTPFDCAEAKRVIAKAEKLK